MNRRGFFGRVLAAYVGVKVAPTLPAPPALAFHPDAFAMAMDPLTPLTGVSVRFIRPARFDMLYGVSAVRPPQGVIVNAANQ